MAKRVEYINQKDNTFDAPGKLFNANPPIVLRSPLTRLPSQGSGTEGIVPPPKVRQTFDLERDLTPEIISDTPPPPPIMDSLIGSFAAVRSARILRQHQISLWGDLGLSILTSPQGPDFTADQIDRMYTDFQLFNYLPAAMTPDRATFTAMIQPSQANSFIKDNLDNLAVLSAAPVPDVPDEVSLPDPVPFADELTPFCQLINRKVQR